MLQNSSYSGVPKERYKDFGRGTLGNFRYAIAGTERGYELGFQRQVIHTKLLTNGKYDPDWIRTYDRVLVAGKDINDPEWSSIMGQVIIPHHSNPEVADNSRLE